MALIGSEQYFNYQERMVARVVDQLIREMGRSFYDDLRRVTISLVNLLGEGPVDQEPLHPLVESVIFPAVDEFLDHRQGYHRDVEREAERMFLLSRICGRIFQRISQKTEGSYKRAHSAVAPHGKSDQRTGS